MRLATLIWLSVSICFGAMGSEPREEPSASPTPPIDSKVIFQVALMSPHREFHIGERIRIKLSFSSKVADRYHLDEATYDRSGRMHYETFKVDPADGAVDPLAKYFASGTFIGGGLTNESILSPEPWMIELNLNEWLRFTKPGEYKLTVSSERVALIDVSSPTGTHPITAVSNVVTFKILPPDPEWEKKVFDGAARTLKAATPADFENRESGAFRAVETLRFLGNADAKRELVRLLAIGGEADSDCFFGLVASPEEAVTREVLEQALSDPDYSIGNDFIGLLKEIEGHQDDDYSREDQKMALEKVISALPNKRGEALRETLYKVFESTSSGTDPVLPKETIQKLGRQLVRMFDQLSPEQQESLLDDRWEYIKTPELVPLLKWLAHRDLSNVASGEKRDVTSLANQAMQRWKELDPTGAQREIDQGINLPGMQPNDAERPSDKNQSELDEELVERFAAMDDSDPSTDLTSQIARRASPAILPQVLKKFDHHSGDWCKSQNDILGYILRVDPSAAKPRIEKTIAARRYDDGCNYGTLKEISEVHYDPVLEEIAIRELDDPDLKIAADAASTLGQFGSASAEAPLWRRYESWSKSCEGRETELNVAYKRDFDSQEGKEVSLGRELFGALSVGRGWLADPAKFRRLLAMTKLRIISQGAGEYFEDWNERPIKIWIHDCPPDFIAKLGEYEFRSIERLKQKLGQFPSKTPFAISTSFDAKEQPCVADLREFLIQKGMSLAEESKSPEESN